MDTAQAGGNPTVILDELGIHSGQEAANIPAESLCTLRCCGTKIRGTSRVRKHSGQVLIHVHFLALCSLRLPVLDAWQAGLRHSRAFPPHVLHGCSRHGQDHRRSTDGTNLAAHGLLPTGARCGGNQGRPGGPVRRPHRTQDEGIWLFDVGLNASTGLNTFRCYFFDGVYQYLSGKRGRSQPSPKMYSRGYGDEKGSGRIIISYLASWTEI